MRIWTKTYIKLSATEFAGLESQRPAQQSLAPFFSFKMDGKGNVSYWCLSYPLSAWWMRRLRVLREAVDPFRSDPWHDLTLQKSVCVGSVCARSLLWYDESTGENASSGPVLELPLGRSWIITWPRDTSWRRSQRRQLFGFNNDPYVIKWFWWCGFLIRVFDRPELQNKAVTISASMWDFKQKAMYIFF